jgi:tetratricopeptide (TPR) repeat protein
MSIFASNRIKQVKKLAKKVINGGYQESEDALKELAKLDGREEAIPIFMEHYRHGDKNLRAVGSLGGLGTVAAIEPLLEIFREARPSQIEENGWVTDDTKGNDGGPASAMVKVPSGIERLRSICSPEEYERILVVAHDYGVGFDREGLTTALGELATPKTIGRLIIQLWNYTDPDDHPTEITALVKSGKKAHPQLLKALTREFPANRRYQTIYRKLILKALKDSGDELCVPIIQSVMESDSAIAGDALAVIEEIARRCPGVEIPVAKEPKPKSIKSIVQTGDAYVDSCFMIEFQEFDEGRDLFEIPEVKVLSQAGNSGRIEDALRHAEALRSKYPDLYFSYMWLSILYRKQGRTADAVNALNDGLRLSRSKYELCQNYGDMEWELGHLPEAVRWWIKSIVIQTSTNSLGNFVPFLQLSYVAEAAELQGACSHLRQFVDRMRAGEIRLNADVANKLYSATRAQGNASMKQAIDLLDSEYLS